METETRFNQELSERELLGTLTEGIDKLQHAATVAAMIRMHQTSDVSTGFWADIESGIREHLRESRIQREIIERLIG